MYHGKHYDSCINVDNGGTPWCFHSKDNTSNDEYKSEWGICTHESCPTMKGTKFSHLFSKTYAYN